ncbi:hypothetical protein U8047_006491 [Pseudomonas aeruginosa]|uniref:hypothetical protein n=1 Tax=Pseudomonas aeruginosa TaxID=287 RepID=UPI0011EB0461|nr:hypothetical protein [Pseudomonas aeruginosa]EMB2825418.1 hypothetical protein [Pseudomonas aeruginosa]TYT31499.1 hypothetical protein FZC29_32885 [Pseudomonas aeruginosa]
MIHTIERARARIPWWANLSLGAVGVLVGALLAVRPFQSLAALLWLTVGGLLMTGLHLLTRADPGERPWVGWLSGLLWVGAAALAARWPGLTIRTLAVLGIGSSTALFGESGG